MGKQDLPPTKAAEVVAQHADSHLSASAIQTLVTKVPIAAVMEQLEDMLVAETPQGNPDWRARTDAIKLWLSYVIGLPVQRQEIVTHKISSQADPVSLLSNPATLEAITRKLAGTDAGAKLVAALSERKVSGKASES